MRNRLFALFGIAIMLLFAALTVLPDEAEARRFGGGSSFGSRSSRSFSTPRQSTSRSTTSTSGFSSQSRQGSAAATQGGMGRGLMAGLGGLLLGGMLGGLLFGTMGSGIGFLEILLIGGAIFLGLRWLRSRQAGGHTIGGHNPLQREAGVASTPGSGGGLFREAQPLAGGGGEVERFSTDQLPRQFSTAAGADEVDQGLAAIAAMDPGFDEAAFLEGARSCFLMVQNAWSDWSVERLRPLLTERMWAMAEEQANALKRDQRRDVTERIAFQQARVSEAWQEAGEDWLTVHFQVSLIEYAVNGQGQVIEGDPENPVAVEEYWTFTRPVGSGDPNWKLSAIQQPGEVAKSAR